MTLSALQIGMEWFSEFPGGLNRVYAQLIAELVNQGVNVSGLVAGSDDVLKLSNGHVRSFAHFSDSLPKRMLGLRRTAQPWFRRHSSQSVIVSHFALHALPILDYAARRPFVVHFQGPWGQESLIEGASARSAAARERVERLIYGRADALVVLSGAFRDILINQFQIRAERVHVIPGGVEANRFAISQSPDECRQELGWPLDRPVVLCVRRLVRRVGLDMLLDAARIVHKAIPDVFFCIAGTGPLRDELAQRIRSISAEQYIRLLGFVDDDILPLAYRAATLSVVPSVALEGFGLITAESLAAGTPCVVTPVDALSEIMNPLAPQLVALSKTAEDLAVVLIEALDGRRKVPSAEECAAYARTSYDWPVMAARVRAVYESVV